MIPEVIPTRLTKRTPCAHQGTSHAGFADDDNPCLICGGDIRKMNDNVFICPFEDSRDKGVTVFRDSVNMKYITATERYFNIRQQMKIESNRESSCHNYKGMQYAD